MLKESQSKTYRQKWVVMTIAGILVLAAVVLPSGCRERNPIDRGPVFAAVEKTLAKPGPVRDDLIRRGLATTPTVDEKTGSPVPGEIKIGEIEKLVKGGVYAIDEQGYLSFGPSYSPSP
jgi:hypothetical protein